MIEIYTHENLKKKDVSKPSIFLAGPSPRAKKDYNWRPEAIDYLNRKGFEGTVYIPLPRDGNWLSNYDAQVEWELKYLNEAKIIAFWIPRDLVSLPGFTTNVEFGMFVKSGKIVLGYPKDAQKMRYLHYIGAMNKVPICNTLKETLDMAIVIIKK